MIASGLLARNAVARGMRVPAWVKTSLAPGSRVVTAYLERAGLLEPLAALGFNVAGYGCTTCIGNSGPLEEEIATAVEREDLLVAAVLSGNRNFEGRIHPAVRAAYLASPPLVVALALAGNVVTNLDQDPVGNDRDGSPSSCAISGLRMKRSQKRSPQRRMPPSTRIVMRISLKATLDGGR